MLNLLTYKTYLHQFEQISAAVTKYIETTHGKGSYYPSGYTFDKKKVVATFEDDYCPNCEGYQDIHIPITTIFNIDTEMEKYVIEKEQKRIAREAKEASDRTEYELKWLANLKLKHEGEL